MKDITYNSAVKEIKERVSILTLIENFVSLKKAGKSHMGLCPFHEEKTPSFHVSEDRGVFHCFGCGAGGDIFGFLMQHKKLTFPEALEELAKRAGVKLEKSAEPQKKPAANNLFLRINALTGAYYHKQLLET